MVDLVEVIKKAVNYSEENYNSYKSKSVEESSQVITERWLRSTITDMDSLLKELDDDGIDGFADDISDGPNSDDSYDVAINKIDFGDEIKKLDSMMSELLQMSVSVTEKGYSGYGKKINGLVTSIAIIKKNLSNP